MISIHLSLRPPTSNSQVADKASVIAHGRDSTFGTSVLWAAILGSRAREFGPSALDVPTRAVYHAQSCQYHRASSSVGWRPLLNNLLGPRGVKSKGVLRKRKTRRRSKTENEWNCGDGAEEVGKNCSRPFKSWGENGDGEFYHMCSILKGREWNRWIYQEEILELTVAYIADLQNHLVGRLDNYKKQLLNKYKS